MHRNFSLTIFAASMLFTVGFGCATSKGKSSAELGMVTLIRAPQPLPVGFQPGKGMVRAVRGQAEFSREGDTWFKLKVKTVLQPGSAVVTGAGASVDLFLGNNGPVIRLLPDSRVWLLLDKETDVRDFA